MGKKRQRGREYKRGRRDRAAGETEGEKRKKWKRDRQGEDIYRGEEETTRKERKGTGKTEGRRYGGVGETMHGEQV